MEIYSKMIGDEVLHAMHLEPEKLLEGWGVEGIKTILSCLAKERPDDEFVDSNSAAAFYAKIEPMMSEDDEVWARVAPYDLKDIRLNIDGRAIHFPNLFVFWES